jgi:phosphoglycerate dehydrogenase-like enzyme
MTRRPLVLLDPHPRPRARIFDAGQWARLAAMAEVVEAPEGAPMPDALADEALARAFAVLGQTALTPERIARAPHLRAVVNVEGNFLQNVDYAGLFARGVHVLSTGTAFAVPVAEMCVALALDLARGLTQGDRAIREGREVYGSAGNADAVMLSRARVGILGYGNIGRALRRVLAGFEARVAVHDPWLPDAVIRDDGAEPLALDALLRTSDFLFVLAGVTSENGGFLDAAHLARVRSGACLVLAGRAAVVDFDALVAEARSGRIRVATDVFPNEPLEPDDPVRRSAMLMSAHRAGGTPFTARTMGEMILDDLALILRGLPPVRLQQARPETVSRLRSPPARGFTRPA